MNPAAGTAPALTGTAATDYLREELHLGTCTRALGNNRRCERRAVG
jgi:hypothetical protein